MQQLLKKFIVICCFYLLNYTNSLFSSVLLHPIKTLQKSRISALRFPAGAPKIYNNGVAVQNPPGLPLGNYFQFLIRGEKTQIFFPENGAQQSTAVVARCACANKDNSLFSPITEWYMQMFGWKKPGKPTVKTGKLEIPLGVMALCGQDPCIEGSWIPAQTVDIEIITLDPSMGNQPTCVIHSRTYRPMTRKEMFLDLFRQIAANPVGRVLLYRLLIEITREATITRRNIAAHSGIMGVGVFYDDQLFLLRNNCRSITVKFDTSAYFGHLDHTLALNGNTYGYSNVLHQNAKGQLTTAIDSPLHLSVELFYELLHWYHCLRNPKRFLEEGCPL